MSEIAWYYPETVAEAVDLIGREGVVPHGGGTGLLRGSLKNVKGLVDLSKLKLRFQRRRGHCVELGAGTTFAEAAAYLRGIEGGSLLAGSLESAATTPLRNRITLGGSVYLFPPWSDLMGPLLALDAEVELAGESAGCYSVHRYTNEKELRRGRLITGIHVNLPAAGSFYYREVRTFSDHPVFTLTLICKKKGDRIEQFRAVVTGCVGRYMRLKRLEKLLVGSSVEDVEFEQIAHAANVRFAGKKALSPQYLKEMVAVQVQRGLEGFRGDSS